MSWNMRIAGSAKAIAAKVQKDGMYIPDKLKEFVSEQVSAMEANPNKPVGAIISVYTDGHVDPGWGNAKFEFSYIVLAEDPLGG